MVFTTNKYKWLKKMPESPHQVLAIINEANTAYEEMRDGKKIHKKEAENKYIKHGLITGALFTLDVKEGNRHYGCQFRVIEVKGTTVHAYTIGVDKGDNKWRFINWSTDHFIMEE